MKPIMPSCRELLTAEDWQFAAETLASHPEDIAKLRELLAEPAARDMALESERLFRKLLESPELVRVSPRFYFYVMARRCLREFRSEIAEYLASLLTAYIDIRRLRTLPGHPELTADYVTDMLAALNDAPGDHQFFIRAHVGNYTLFMAGIFPEHIRHRAERRGAPDITFYEKVGSANYRIASDHRLAHRHDLVDVFRTIADHFSDVRQDLNHMTDRLLHIETTGSFTA